MNESLRSEVGTGSRLASGAVWFFALAAIANGVAHPALAVIGGGYFHGLFTVPFLGAPPGC
jgi:hypothetical protein